MRGLTKTLTIGEPFHVGDARVTSILLNHPVVNFGYRVDCGGKSVFFTGDHEPYYNVYDPEDTEYGEYQRMVDEKRQQVDEALRGVDLLIADASYTAEEYASKRGWGHGTFDTCLEWGRRIGARRVVCTHHEPTRSDDIVEAAFAEALGRQPRGDEKPEAVIQLVSYLRALGP